MSQHLSTLLRGGVKRPQHRLSTNVETNVVPDLEVVKLTLEIVIEERRWPFHQEFRKIQSFTFQPKLRFYIL